MINIKIIKIQKSAYYISILILVFLIFFFLYKLLSLGGVEISSLGSLIKTEKILISTLNQGFPYLGVTNSQFIDKTPTGLISTLFYLLTDIDFEKPSSLITAQMPFFYFVETESVMTPGIELPYSDNIILENNLNNKWPDKENKQKEEPSRNNSSNQSNLNIGEPLVLIYHSHSTECYSETVEEVFSAKEASYHSKNLDITVVRVGEELKRCLENKHGIKVIHDKTMNDIPSYMMSYTNSLKTFERNIKEYPSIKIAIDLHRDAPYLDRLRSREATTFNIDGQETARIMLVVGTDKLFTHPNWKKNYQFALAIQQTMDNFYKGLSRKIDLRNERFNQHLLDKAILVEIGCHGNTLEEALKSAELFADVLSKVIKNLQ